MSDPTKPWIRFARKTFPDFQVDKNANLMRSLHDRGIPVASSCRGEGICANCRLFVVSGGDNLTPQNAVEQFLREKYPTVKKDQRISCQADVCGDVTIDASYW